MPQFHRGARVAGADAEQDDSLVDVTGLVDQALLWQNVKTRDNNNSVDFIGRGMFEGTPFKVTAVRRTSRTGRGMLKLFFVPLKGPPPREPSRG
jgi:hypothetical protein